MILPTKFIEEEDTLLQVGIDLLECHCQIKRDQ